MEGEEYELVVYTSVGMEDERLCDFTYSVPLRRMPAKTGER